VVADGAQTPGSTTLSDCPTAAPALSVGAAWLTGSTAITPAQ
jgi:hypothetical protein